jgi:hypothetical protein
MVTEVFDRRWANATSIAVRVSFSILGPFQFADCAADHGCTSVQVWTILADFIAGLRQPAQLLDVHPVATMPAVMVVGVVAHTFPMATICTCSEIPLVDGRWKLAFHRGFHGRADRIQNHLFSLTDANSVLVCQ